MVTVAMAVGHPKDPMPWIISGTDANPGRGKSQCPRQSWDHQWLLVSVLSQDSAVPRPWRDKAALWMGWQGNSKPLTH